MHNMKESHRTKCWASKEYWHKIQKVTSNVWCEQWERWTVVGKDGDFMAVPVFLRWQDSICGVKDETVGLNLPRAHDLYSF
jgi:hypothetical protein